jgi:spermidine synthase
LHIVTGFVFVASSPTTPVIVLLGVALVVLAIALWWRLGRRAPRATVVGGSFALVAVGGLAVGAGSPCDVESTYFCAVVTADPERRGGRVLTLDGVRNSFVDLDDPTHLAFGYTRILGDVIEAVAPGAEPIDTAHIGGGGFTMPRFLEATRPGSTSIVFELDPSVVRLAQDELGLVLSSDLRAVTGDARVNLRDLPPSSVDLVIGDAFGGEAVPWHLTTREFAEQIRDRLRPDGVYAMNLIDHGELAFARAAVATLREVFGHVAVVAPPGRLARSAPGGNLVVVASRSPLPVDAVVAANRARGGDDEIVHQPARLDALIDGARVLTDEFAPVDQLLAPAA